MTCCPNHSAGWHYLARGADAADEVLTTVFGIRSAVRKDNSDPTSKLGFEKILRKMILELFRVTQPLEQKALQDALHALDVNWAGMSSAEITEALDDAGKVFGGVPKLLVQPVVESLTKMGVQMVTASKAAAAGRYDLPIAASFNTVDQRVIDHAAQSHAFYVRDEFGKRQAAFSSIARTVVSKGLSEGLDKYEIGKDLKAAASAAMVNRSDSYWTMIASIFATRSRTWGMLASFEEGGIERYEISATLDEVSCDVCRFMDGKTFSVASAVSSFKKVAESDDPEAAAQHQPFMSVGMSESGDKGLFFGSGASRQAVARVTESAVGEKDALGKFSNAMGSGDLEKNGLGAPPFHPSCRCLTMASFEAAPAQPQRSGPAPKPVALPKPLPKPVVLPPPVQAPPARPVDPNADLALPLPSGLAQPTAFVDSRGVQIPVFDGKRAAAQLRALEKLYSLDAEDEGVVFSSGDAGIKAAPKKGNPMPYATKLRGLGSIDDLLAAHGERLTIADAALDVVQATKRTVDRRAVAAMIASPPPVLDVIPTYIRHDGKIYLHAGHEEVMAAYLTREEQSARKSRLIDLDKLGNVEKPDNAKLFSALGTGLGAEDPAKQKALREALREQLRYYGIVTRDDRRGGEPGYAFPRAGDGMDAAVVGSDMQAHATHAWDGLVTMSNNVANSARASAQLLLNDPAYAIREQAGGKRPDQINAMFHGLRTLIHEEIHGASPALSTSYSGIGVGIEEASTEILARKVARNIIGLPNSFALPRPNTITGRYEGGYTTYYEYISRLFGEVASKTGHDGIQLRIEEAMLETRKWHAGEVYETGEDQVRDFAERLKGADGKPLQPDVRARLVAALVAKDGPFR